MENLENSSLEYSIKHTIEKDHPNLFKEKNKHSLRAKLVEHENLLNYMDQLGAFTKHGLYKKQKHLPLDDKIEPVSIHVITTYIEILWEEDYLHHTPTVTGLKNAGMIYFDPKNPLAEKRIEKLKSRFRDFKEFSAKNAKVDKIDQSIDLVSQPQQKESKFSKIPKCSLDIKTLLKWKETRNKTFEKQIDKCSHCKRLIKNHQDRKS